MLLKRIKIVFFFFEVMRLYFGFNLFFYFNYGKWKKVDNKLNWFIDCFKYIDVKIKLYLM